MKKQKICIGDYLYHTDKYKQEKYYQIMLDKETNEIYLEGARDWNWAEKVTFDAINWDVWGHTKKEDHDKDFRKFLDEIGMNEVASV